MLSLGFPFLPRVGKRGLPDVVLLARNDATTVSHHTPDAKPDSTKPTGTRTGLTRAPSTRVLPSHPFWNDLIARGGIEKVDPIEDPLRRLGCFRDQVA